MPKVIFVLHDGTSIDVDANNGESVMQAAVNNMVDGIVAECGGCQSCATCHVYIDEAWRDTVGNPSSDEKAMLELAIDPNDSSRLSCQITLSDDLDGLIIKVPAAQF